MDAGSITLIAYGSLMSGYGLARFGRLCATAVSRVVLHNARRGFGKPSQHGDHLAMVLEPEASDQPIVAAPVASESALAVDALAITIGGADLPRVAAREGYAADAMRTLLEHARNDDQSLADYLWSVAATHGFDPARYRRALSQLVDYTSPHYIPHPVATGSGVPAVVFLPPGREGSGRDDVVPVRVRTGMLDLLSLCQAWERKPSASQADYFVMCLLAHVHGLHLGDLLDGLDADDRLRTMLSDRLAPENELEPARFCAALGLETDAYWAAVTGGSRQSAVSSRQFRS